MNDATSNAIQAVAIFGFLSVAVYGVTSCLRAPFEQASPQVECIKQRGNWSALSGCSFDPANASK